MDEDQRSARANDEEPTSNQPKAGIRGWLPDDAPSASDEDLDPGEAAPLNDRTGTALYAEPDGWSKVLGNLPDGAAVTVCRIEGNFLRITTADGVVGYVSQAARDHLAVNAQT